MEPPWIAWIRDISDNAPDRQVAARIGIAPSTIGRWRDYPPKADVVVELARAYRAPVADGLIAAGYVTPGELREPRYERDLGKFTASELITELATRITDDGERITQHRRTDSPADDGMKPAPDGLHLDAQDIPDERTLE